MDTMDSTLDETTLSTISLLEGRILRIEHLLYGHSTPQPKTTAVDSLQELELRFSKLLQHIRVYGELLRLYKSQPSLFQPPPSSQPPLDLSQDAIRATVLAAATSYPAIASSLTSIADTPIPDPAQSANLAALAPRMRGIEAIQLAQAAEISELRARSEIAVRQWHAYDVMGYADSMARVEGRIEMVDRAIKTIEKSREEI
ncbi:Uu.00g115720.m01.CDS01 [Anthostomella pinea]|uniref:Uu.00g115720.m01.CDS01 n=1 Tax=Anthostomella pinea TaxID=933095 RepID=A0AAI8VFT8_9PEZI|nr:Uu.00g115720.m01.CDS01 [Anthostomella pinea]